MKSTARSAGGHERVCKCRRQEGTSEGFRANRQAEADLGMQVVLGNASQQVIEFVLNEMRRHRRNASGFPVGNKRCFRFFYHYTHVESWHCPCPARAARPWRYCRGTNTGKVPSTLVFINLSGPANPTVTRLRSPCCPSASRFRAAPFPRSGTCAVLRETGRGDRLNTPWRCSR